MGNNKIVKFKYFATFLLLSGVLSCTVIIHEFVHVIQLKDYKTRICLFNKGTIAYVEPIDTVLYETKEKRFNDEVIASIVCLIFFLIAMLYIYKNSDLILYEKN